jgi:hypothetical protein
MALSTDGMLTGRLFIHQGDDSGFRASPFTSASGRDRR